MLHQIGVGALGPVFRTYEPARDRLVAVKVFRLDIVPEQAQALADALTPATQASLFHPSIVEPVAAGVEGTLAYRAEEYVAAESLDVAMRHYAPAPIEKVLPFITQLAGAIDFARAAGIGHGGLHPRDIFVTPDEARATGFGVVEALQSVGIRAPIRRPYTAPERIDGIKWGTAADVFSLGAIAFELLTARRPAGTGPQIGVISDSDQGRALHAVLARAMDDDFSSRYPTALAFAAALEEAGRASAAPSPAAIPVAAAATGAAASAPAAAPIEPVVVTPGEFEVEKELDPVLAALDEDISPERRVDAAEPADRSLFDEPLSIDEPLRREALDTDSFDDLNDEPERFTDEFVEEQQAEAEARRPLEAVHETTASPRGNAPEPPMFGSTDQGHESESVEYGERARPVILPVAVTLIIGLLLGFGAGYFVFGRDRGSQVATAPAPAATQRPAANAGGPATPDKPGQYSEQKVAPPPVTTAPAVAPPIPAETAPSTRGRAASEPARRTPVATTGRLVVTSTPARAGVIVNNVWRGRTPLTLDNVKFGRYAVRVVQPGYATARDEFTISAANASHEFSPRLQRSTAPTRETPAPVTPSRGGVAGRGATAAATQTFTGSLYVDSRPRGATVFVDGRSLGQTPLSIPELAIGSHVVRIVLTGKKPWTTTTRVTAGEMQRVTGSLEDIQFQHE